MIVMMGLGWALIAGADPRRVAILGLNLVFPWILLPLIALAYMRPATRRPDSVAFCEAVASELRSGATLLQALTAAGVAADSKVLGGMGQSGATPAEMARVLAGEFVDVGRELAAAVDAVARSGAPSAELFDEIGALALAQAEIAHEVRIASAPARATVVVFVAAPFIYLSQRLSSGGLGELLLTPAQRGVTLVGLGLLVAGLLAVLALVGRVR